MKSKSRKMILSLLMALILIVPAYAQTPRAAVQNVTLYFRGQTAYCEVYITNNTTDRVSATIKLKHDGDCIKTWYRSSACPFNFLETYPVEAGETYTLSVDYTLAGKTQPSLSTSGTC